MSDAHLPQDHVQLALALLPTHLRPILAALLSGATDTAASHRLNVSPRTFSRRITEMLEYFDVQTRFQAGVKIGLSGATNGPLSRPTTGDLSGMVIIGAQRPVPPAADPRPPMFGGVRLS